MPIPSLCPTAKLRLCAHQSGAAFALSCIRTHIPSHRPTDVLVCTCLRRTRQPTCLDAQSFRNALTLACVPHSAADSGISRGCGCGGNFELAWQLQRERPLWHLWVERPSVLGVQVVMPRESCPCVIQCLAPPSGEPSPGADVRGGEPSPGADVGGASPVLVRMWHTAGAYCLAPLIAVSCPD